LCQVDGYPASGLLISVPRGEGTHRLGNPVCAKTMGPLPLWHSFLCQGGRAPIVGVTKSFDLRRFSRLPTGASLPSSVSTPTDRSGAEAATR
jgi:hypothetical protein